MAEGGPPFSKKDGAVRLSSETGLTYERLREIALTEGTLDAATRAYRVGDDVYLTPGTYLLRETAAPQGYERAADVRFEVAPLAERVDVERGAAYANPP